MEALGILVVAAVGLDGGVDSSGKVSLLKNDVMLSVVFEMMRIYTHPFLAGCSEEVCMEGGDIGAASGSGSITVSNGATNDGGVTNDSGVTSDGGVTNNGGVTTNATTNITNTTNTTNATNATNATTNITNTTNTTNTTNATNATNATINITNTTNTNATTNPPHTQIHHTTPNLPNDSTHTNSYWITKFREASGKICVLEFLLKCLFKVSPHSPYDVGIQLQCRRRVLQVSPHVSVLGTLLHSVRVACRMVHVVASLHCSFFGVHTLDELEHSIHMVHLNDLRGMKTVALLGTLPAHVSLPLSFLEHVILLDSDLDPATDVDQLRITFDLGARKVREGGE